MESGSPNAGRSDRPIGFWLKLVDRLINECFDADLRTVGVTRRGWQVLNVLGRGQTTLAEIDGAVAPFVGTAEESSAAPTVSELVGRGWVGDDGGSYSLTEEGRDALQRLGHTVGETRQRLADGITSDEYAATLDVLERMARNLGWEG